MTRQNLNIKTDTKTKASTIKSNSLKIGQINSSANMRLLGGGSLCRILVFLFLKLGKRLLKLAVKNLWNF